MRQAMLYYLVQTWAADLSPLNRRNKPVQAPSPSPAPKGLTYHAARSAYR